MRLYKIYDSLGGIVTKLWSRLLRSRGSFPSKCSFIS